MAELNCNTSAHNYGSNFRGDTLEISWCLSTVGRLLIKRDRKFAYWPTVTGKKSNSLTS